MTNVINVMSRQKINIYQINEIYFEKF